MRGKIQFLRSLILSKKTNRKIIVIESDDWGSERIPNIETRTVLKASGIDMDTNPHAKFDTLERVEDLINLEQLLIDIKAKYNKTVKLTANFITANPDFEKIKAVNFESYFYESFDKTYQKRDSNNKVLEQILKLNKLGFFIPQFHGREHINALFWLDELKNNNRAFKVAFNHKTYAIDASSAKSNRKNLMAALEYEHASQKQFIEESLHEGHQIFKNTFGYNSKTFIAPRYVWNKELEPIFATCGFTHLQTALFQQSPMKSGYKNVFHYTGQKSKTAQMSYLTRNVYFEPAYGKVDWVQKSLSKVDLAFKFKTPAIISMHRINFVGGLNEQARDNNLKQFKNFIESIIMKYPDVEFMSSDELAKIV